MVIGLGDYVNCYIENQELTEEYQGASTYRVKIHSNVVLPVEIGARVFPSETNGAGGYIMLTPPNVEVVTAEYFIYDLTFMGFSHQLETVILFNQDAVGWGWETIFSLVGTGQDFIDLIVKNMNRTVPTDSNLELWQAGTVDATGTTLITFDGDNCLTALRKVSQAFGLPYEVQGNGGFHEYWVSIKLTAVKKQHIHTYSLGTGLSKFKRLGDSDRKFATAICALGSTKNIPYNYRGGLRRLHCGMPTPILEDTVWDENIEWGYSEVAKDPTTTIELNSTLLPMSGSVCLRIANYTGAGLSGTIIRFSAPLKRDITGSSLKMWVGADFGTFSYSPQSVFSISLMREDSVLGSYTVNGYEWGLAALAVPPFWKEITIPTSYFKCGLTEVDAIVIHIYYWSNAFNESGCKFDNIRFESGGDQQLENFIFGTTYTDAHGKIELAVVNEDIFPRLQGSITGLVLDSPTQFIDSAMPFDLNEKAIGTSLYLIPDVTPKINFLSGNLSGYSLAVNWYKHDDNQFDLVPYTEESGNVIPSLENLAYCLKVGDRYVITEILLPEAYITAAEQELYEWAVEQYAKYVQANELAEVEIDHVWLNEQNDNNPSELYYCYTDDPTPQVHFLTEGFFKVGDLIHIYIEGLYDRELIIQSVVQERAQGLVTMYKLTLSSNEPMNITGMMLMGIKELGIRIDREQQKMGKYFHK